MPSAVMREPRVVVLGGGLAGMATAYALARAGYREITILEQGRKLGGLAGSFERDGHFYPLGYHHILHRDRCLLWFLQLLDVLPAVRWRRIRMLVERPERLYDLGRPVDFLRYPLPLADKLRFVRLMLRAYGRSDWSEWEGRSGSELLDSWASPVVRRELFDPLLRLKFGRGAEGVSAAWIGTRLSYREGSSPLGYVPHANWTTLLCDGLAARLVEDGCDVRLGAGVAELATDGDRAVEARTLDGERFPGDVFVSTVPTEVYRRLTPGETTPRLDRIRYTALLSVVAASDQKVRPDFYWLNLSSLRRTACAFFLLSSLNPAIGARGESCVNFITHLPSRADPLYSCSDAELLAAYRGDFRAVLGSEYEPSWTHVSRIPIYSPIFDVDYRNPPVRSTRFANVYFAGIYRSFPSAASTGNALETGLEAARAVLRDRGSDSGLLEAVRACRLQRMPRE